MFFVVRFRPCKIHDVPSRRAGRTRRRRRRRRRRKKKEGKLEEGGRFKTLDDEDRERFSWENNYNAVRLLPR